MGKKEAAEDKVSRPEPSQRFECVFRQTGGGGFKRSGARWMSLG
jgi:hypothetical protein